VRTGTDRLGDDEYEGGTLVSIERYFNHFEEPFIKGLLRDKGSDDRLMFKKEIKQTEVLGWMEQLANDFNHSFQGVPIYLYLKREHRKSEPNREQSFTLVWRIRRKIARVKDNQMISHLFSQDGKYEYLLKIFGPGMRQKLQEYDECRLLLNMAENLLRYQKRTICSYRHAIHLANQ